MKKVVAIKEYCVACGLCEVYCATVHSRYPDSVLKAFKLSPQKPVSRVFLEKSEQWSGGIQCRHCKDAPCIAACITGAMYRNRDGIVLLDEERCVQCSTCVIACPYGLIKESDMGGRKVLLKCDLCYQLAESPTCVTYCPNEALIWVEEGETL